MFILVPLNLQTGSIRQVNHSLIEGIDLNKLMEISYFTPTLYDAVVRLTNKTRNKFIPGRRGEDLHLIQPHQHNLGVPDRHLVPDPNEVQHSLTDLGEPDRHLVPDSNEDHYNITESGNDLVEEHNVGEPVRPLVPDANEGQHGITESADGLIEVLNKHGVTEFEDGLNQPADDTRDDSARIHHNEAYTGFNTPPETRRYRTRFLGKRHVPVHASLVIDTASTQHTEILPTTRGEKRTPKSLIKTSKDFPYNFLHNYDPQALRKVDHPMFITRLKALRLHKEICTEKLCKNCELYEKVAGFKFNQLDFTRYKSQDIIPTPAGQNSKKTPSRVKFTLIESPGNTEYRPVMVNSVALLAALKNSVSLSETKLLISFE